MLDLPEFWLDDRKRAGPLLIPGFKATRYWSGLILSVQKGNLHPTPLPELGAHSIKKRGAQLGGLLEGGIPGDSPRPRCWRNRFVSSSIITWIALVDEVA